MAQIGKPFPTEPRKTALFKIEDWYQHFLAEKTGKEYQPIKRSNFGQYSMAINYLTTVFEEAQAVNQVAAYNIDHMAQIEISGRDSLRLLERVLPASLENMKTGQCKYTLLLTEKGTVLDDLIIMRLDDDKFILVINAGHDITDKAENLISDADYILSYKLDNEDVKIRDISDDLVKIDIQGKLSYRVIKELYGQQVLRNRHKPNKNMPFFSFNEFEYNSEKFIISRTGYTNRWGWELYVPATLAEDEFKRIATKVWENGGLLVGLGGRDENRISAGTFGLPLYGHEYDDKHTPTNAPLFNAAVDMHKDDFVGKKALEDDIKSGNDKRMVLFITEGIVEGRGIYRDNQRIGTVTSSINSPNVPQEKREFIGSKRKNVHGPDGMAAIGLGWVRSNPFEVDEQGNDILEKDGKAVRIPVEFYREDEQRNPKGKPILGYISGDGVNPATAPKPLKHIENL